ncbi:J domain-containing protein, partial [Legionella brunensis]
MAKKLYELLEIDETATAEDIRKAYKKQALKHHPDKNKDDPQAQERFKDISNAYAILSDEVLRPLYDKGQIDDTGNPVAEEVNATFFSEDPEERAKQFEEILKQFHKATEEAKKAAQKVFEEEIKPHLNDKQVKNPPGSKTYYIYIPGFNPNTKKDYAKDFFDVENDELRSKIAEELHNKDGILVFESREEALSAGRLVRDKFWGNDSDDVVIECFLSPELLEKTTSFFKSGGSEIDMEELNDHGKRNCFSFKQSPIGSNLFSLGNISAVYIVNALVNLCAHPGDPEAKKILDVRLEKEVIHNSNFHNPKIKAIIQALDKGETKLKKQEILLREIKKNQLSVAEFSLL